MSNESVASAWVAIEDNAVKAETMKLRATLMMALDRHIRTKGWTQAEAARRRGGAGTVY